MPRDHTITRLARVKLRESGLTDNDAKILGIKTLTATQTSNLSSTFDSLPTLQLPYHDEHGKATGFYRLRYLQQPVGFNRHRWHKYTQPPNTSPAVYLPTAKGINWDNVFSDVSIPLFITEGELKAAAGCKYDFLTIGLGGVYAFRSAKFGLGFLPELERCVWRQRLVMLIFDSDVATNPQVAQALHHLATELIDRGAVVSIAHLPALGDNGKTGLDDLLVARGAAGLTHVVEEAELVEASQALWRLNTEYAYILNPGLVVDLAKNWTISAANFTGHYAANRYYYETSKDKLVKRPSAPAWIRWPLRHQLNAIVYSPGKPRVTDDNELNLWEGWGVDATAGDYQPWIELLDYVFAGQPAARKWFEQWAAYPLHYPGEKLYTSVLIWGVNQGTGKSLIGYTLGRIYGSNFREIHQSDLMSLRNTWAAGCQFVLGDEVIGSDRRTDTDRLKGLITQQQCVIDKKYVPEYTIVDRTNYYFTSQHPGAFFLDDQDRRFFVHELEQTPLPDEFYTRYDAWYRSDSGVAALFHRLLRVDLTGFNPHARAMMTKAKADMVDDARSDLGAWVARLHQDPDAVLRLDDQVLPSDLWTNKQLLALYDPDHRTRVTANGLGRELKRAGFTRLGHLPTQAYGVQRVYVVRNVEHWHTARSTEAIRHFDRYFGPAAAKEARY